MEPQCIGENAEETKIIKCICWSDVCTLYMYVGWTLTWRNKGMLGVFTHANHAAKPPIYLVCPKVTTCKKWPATGLVVASCSHTNTSWDSLSGLEHFVVIEIGEDLHKSREIRGNKMACQTLEWKTWLTIFFHSAHRNTAYSLISGYKVFRGVPSTAQICIGNEHTNKQTNRWIGALQ